MDHIDLRQIDEFASNKRISVHKCVVVEYGNIVKALRAMDWNQQQTADLLGLDRRTLRNKVKKLRDAGLTIPTYKRPFVGVKQPKRTDSRPRCKKYVFRDKCVSIDERIAMGETEPDDTQPRTFVKYERK